MQNPEELAQEALKYLDLAQKLEEEKDIEDAISHYQQAADFLKQSGFLIHRIQEIYDRISELKDFLQKEKLYQQIQNKTQIDQFQEQAFTLLEGAKKLEFDGFIDDAVQQYSSAIQLLIQVGWSENQLDDIRIKMKKLTQELDKRKAKIQPKEQISESQKPPIQLGQDEKPQIVGMFGQKRSVEKAEVVRQFREKRKHEEDVQNKAFEYIDTAKIFEKDKKFNEAILNYEKAIVLLTSIGWSIQIQNIQTLIEKLKKDKIEFESIQAEQSILLETENIEEKKVLLEKQAEIKKEQLNKFESKKKNEEKIQLKAFNLIDIGNRLERENKYDEAIEEFEQAIEYLRSIEWDTYIQPIKRFVNQIKDKKKREEEAAQLIEKRQKNLAILQDSIYLKQREQIFKSAKDFDNKRKEFEEKRKVETKKEEELFSLLDKADLILKEKKFNDAINEYQKVLSILGDLGSGWETYTSMIKNTISNVEKFKNSQLTKKLEEQKKLEEKERKELEFQKQIITQLEKERNRLKKKEIVIKDREEEIKKFESRKKAGFELLEEAGNYLKRRNPDYNEAISLYIQARHILAENIGWEPEINNLNTLIKDLQQEQASFLERKRVEEQTRLQRQIEYAQFQEEVRKRRLEQEKIRREQEKQYRDIIYKRQHIEQIKNEGLKLIDEGKKQAKYHEFEKAYTYFEAAISKFREIEWKEEIKFIETEIKNTKLLEERVKKEEEKAQLIQKELEKQRILEKKRKEEEEARLKETVDGVTELAGEVTDFIEKEKKIQKLEAEKHSMKIKNEAKEFRKEMSNLIKLKQELSDEIQKKEAEKRKFEEKVQKAKEREEIDELKKMIKDSSKK